MSQLLAPVCRHDKPFEVHCRECELQGFCACRECIREVAPTTPPTTKTGISDAAKGEGT